MHFLGELPNSRKEYGLDLLEKAAEAGSWDAQWFLSEVFADGHYGLRKDPKRAAYYLVLSLTCRSAPAVLAMGMRLKKRQLNTARLADAFVRAAERVGMMAPADVLPEHSGAKKKGRKKKSTKRSRFS